MEFYREYCPPITAQHHTCVGLGLETINKLSILESKYHGILDKLYLVSCEESVDDVPSYTSELPDPLDSDKEHVLVALKISISGRSGILLLDSGYHIGRVITVMKDCQYPHSGWFVQSDEKSCQKYYCYEFDYDNEGYICWQSKESRPNRPEKLISNLIYVELPYLSAVDVTERRNLVYEFKCLVSRNSTGKLIAGVYFPIAHGSIGNTFTIFYQDGPITKRLKMNFAMFEIGLTSSQIHSLSMCNQQLKLYNGELTNTLKYLNTILQDGCFMQQVMEINDEVYRLGQAEE